MSKSQEQPNIDELIFALNETMVGRFDALNERIEKLEKSLSDDVLDLSSEHENQFGNVLQQLRDSGALTDWGDAPTNWPLFHIYSMVWAIATQNGLDPLTITQTTSEFLRNPNEFLHKHAAPTPDA